MNLERDRADYAAKLQDVYAAQDAASAEFNTFLSGSIDEAIELIAELQGKLDEKEIELAEYEKQIDELKMDRFVAESGHIDAVADPPMAQATPGGPIESQITEEPAGDIGHITNETGHVSHVVFHKEVGEQKEAEDGKP